MRRNYIANSTRHSLISRRLRKVVAVVAGALAAGVPVTLIHQGVDAYIERQSEDEVRLAAQRAIALAEWRIGQAIEALAVVGQLALNSCADVDPQALRQAVLTTTPIKEVVVTDEAGAEHCAPSGARTQPKMLSRELRTADDRVYLGAVASSDLRGRALRITWQRAGDPLRLVSTIPSDVFLIDGALGNTTSVPVVRIMFSEGTLIAAPANALEGTAEDGDTIRTHNQSNRYPLLATASVSRA